MKLEVETRNVERLVNFNHIAKESRSLVGTGVLLNLYL